MTTPVSGLYQGDKGAMKGMQDQKQIHAFSAIFAGQDQKIAPSSADLDLLSFLKKHYPNEDMTLGLEDHYMSNMFLASKVIKKNPALRARVGGGAEGIFAVAEVLKDVTDDKITKDMILEDKDVQTRIAKGKKGRGPL